MLPAAEIEKAFDLKEQLRNVDAVFAGCSCECMEGDGFSRRQEQSMRARVYVTLKPSVFDPQGRVVADALVTLGYQDVKDVRQGKFFEVELADADAGDGEGAGDRDGRQAAGQPGDRELPRRGPASEVLGRRVSRIELGLRRLLCGLARARRGGRRWSGTRTPICRAPTR